MVVEKSVYSRLLVLQTTLGRWGGVYSRGTGPDGDVTSYLHPVVDEGEEGMRVMMGKIFGRSLPTRIRDTLSHTQIPHLGCWSPTAGRLHAARPWSGRGFPICETRSHLYRIFADAPSVPCPRGILLWTNHPREILGMGVAGN